MGSIVLVLCLVTCIPWMTSSIALWLMGRYLGVQRATFRQSLVTIAITEAVLLILLLSMISVLTGLRGQRSEHFISLALLAAMLAVRYRIIAWRHVTTWGRTLAMVAVTMATSYPVALIAAKVIVAHYVEAFQVPENSMAPTVLGQRQTHNCEYCQRAFDYAIHAGIEETDQLKCPFCGQIQTTAQSDGRFMSDRILVRKHSLPARWELAVFRKPGRQQTNFLKRIVGLPGEALEIRHGELYANKTLLRKPPSLANDLWFPVATVPNAQSEQALGWTGSARLVDAEWELPQIPLQKNSQEQKFEFSGRVAVSPLLATQSDWSEEGMPVVTADLRLDLLDADVADRMGFSVSWSDGHHQVTATVTSRQFVSITDGEATSTGRLPALAPQVCDYSFHFRDAMASVFINDTQVAVLNLPELTAEQLQATRDVKLEISPGFGLGAVRRVKVFRDVYYRDDVGQTTRFDLGGDQYLALGDNSERSLDSRFWGSVPEKNFVGVVHSTYWPPSRWRTFPRLK
jgi:signal peptidase I